MLGKKNSFIFYQNLTVLQGRAQMDAASYTAQKKENQIIDT